MLLSRRGTLEENMPITSINLTGDDVRKAIVVNSSISVQNSSLQRLRPYYKLCKEF